jgi:ABC-type sugar transport system ATPase subunit
VLEAGVIQQVGTPMDLYMRPVNLFVAQFIGSPAMNTLAGALVSRDGALRARLEGGTELEFRAGPGARDGMAVTVGMRPEHLTLEGEANALTG